jgi:phosphogluconate dehydratase
MLMEMMGVQLPGSSFINPGTDERQLLTEYATARVSEITALGDEYTPLGEVISEKAIVNSIVGLMATGGSTNHAIHLIAIARAAGIQITWGDMSDISSATPLLCRIYPNGQADVNHFQAAGGMGFLIRQLLEAGLVHNDVKTILGDGFERFMQEPHFEDSRVAWRDSPEESLDKDVVTSVDTAFQAEGGLKLLDGNLGKSVIKVSAVKDENRYVKAPAVVLDHQDSLKEKFDAGELERDFVAVVKCQGPKANGMPELHKLTPMLGVLQDKGFKVALVTDGRMSGASGKVPAAIHLSPEAIDGGAIAKVQEGDIVELDAVNGTLNVLAEDFDARPTPEIELPETLGMGRELFEVFRSHVNEAEAGATVFK